MVKAFSSNNDEFGHAFGFLSLSSAERMPNWVFGERNIVDFFA